ncbi:cytochrome c3 family protein [Alcanivorax sp. 1008]|uniref:cytochrome c3 family protein n=1 Tax=Alcanivorax sp. 1008 TaxID=2816853 RepID=UPI001D43F5E8|nr:cytochrome c3 family protein [Alcanivorax sp. 1008]MCC1497811.1 cytochrome c3 family protein [Alcanivorax sp. 1008]
MYVLIRRLGAGSGPTRTFKDEELAVDKLSIGRGTDQELLLPGDRVAYQHAEISLAAGQFRIRALASSGITVNGRSCKMAVLNSGDQILIADYRLIVLPASEGVDLALSLEVLEQQDAPSVDPASFTIRLDVLQNWRPRRWAWLLFTVLLLGGLLLPALVAMVPGWQNTFRSTPLPDDSFWLSGPLHSMHSTIGKDCQACHTKPFAPVTNEACMDCHADTAVHVSEVHPDTSMFEGERCASCHHEHNGEQRMVFDDQRFCSDCHGNLEQRMSDAPAVERATDFHADHPDFRLSLLQWQPQSQSPRQAVDASLQESSHLTFDHATHLDPQGIKSDDGDWQVLNCGDCHQMTVGGVNMAPINMDQHCASCHALSFDLQDPQRVVPHGKPDQVLASLREYYAAQFVQNRAGAGDIRASRPGGLNNLSELQREGLVWVENKSRAVAEDLFERRACATCHEVERSAEDPAQWLVKPVRLNEEWFASSEFPHGRHTQSECIDCHAADQSAQAEDILMPDIAICQECHKGQQANEGLRSGCISCHSYHQFDVHAELAP